MAHSFIEVYIEEYVIDYVKWVKYSLLIYYRKGWKGYSKNLQGITIGWFHTFGILMTTILELSHLMCSFRGEIPTRAIHNPRPKTSLFLKFPIFFPRLTNNYLFIVKVPIIEIFSCGS